MADETNPNRPANQTILRPAAATPQAGIGAPRPSQGVNPQNLNNSPSPGGDGVQSSQSERTAAGMDNPVNQPAQQRINAAQRRESGEQTTSDAKHGLRAGVIQSPGEVLPADAVADMLGGAEQRRLAAQEAAHVEQFGNVPQATLDEMDAGRAALKRHEKRTVSVDNTATTTTKA